MPPQNSGYFFTGESHFQLLSENRYHLHYVTPIPHCQCLLVEKYSQQPALFLKKGLLKRYTEVSRDFQEERSGILSTIQLGRVR